MSYTLIITLVKNLLYLIDTYQLLATESKLSVTCSASPIVITLPDAISDFLDAARCLHNSCEYLKPRKIYHTIL